MKLAADLLCSSLRIVDAVVANLPAVGIICLGARPADNEAKGVDNNITKKGHCSKPADVPHSRVFVVIPHTLKDKAKAGDEFHFNLGNIKLKAKFLRDQKALADGRNKVSVRAFLPTEKMSNGLDCAFFSSVSKQINDSSFYVKPPPDVQPGEVFEVVLFGQKIKIRYPQQVGCDASKPSNSPNQKGRTKPKFRILCCPDQKKRTLGTNPMILMFHLKGCCTCSCVSCTSEDGGAGVHPIKDSNPPEFLVTVPDGTKQNQQFPVEINRQQFLVTCPPQCSPGEMVRIRLPIISTEMKRDGQVRKIIFQKPQDVAPMYTDIKVTEPMLIQNASFLLSSTPYWSYQITSVLSNNQGTWLVRRRFRHVVALEDRLRQACPGSILPPRPDKHATRALEEASAQQSAEFAIQRAKELEQYLNMLAKHPVAGQSNVLRLFLGLQDDIGTAWAEVSTNAFTRLGAVGAEMSMKVAESTNLTSASAPAHEWEDNAELLALQSSENVRRLPLSRQKAWQQFRAEAAPRI